MAMPALGYRHFLIFVVFVGLVITYMLRVNLSVAILAMTNNTAVKEMEALKHTGINETKKPQSSGACYVESSNSTKKKPQRDGQFAWDKKDRGIILGAFFYGYIITEIPGGWLSYRFGSKWIFGLGMLWTAIFTLLTPLTVYLNMPLLIVCRILEGLGEGVAFPCVHGLFAQWVPPSERSCMPALMLSSVGVGTMIGFPLSGALCDTDIGWPMVFYVFGVIGIVWFIAWTIFGSNTPGTSRWISEKECIYIQSSLAETVKTHEERPRCGDVPWLSILKSPAFWSVLLSHMSRMWCLHTLVTLLPTFYKDALNMDITLNGLYSALPYVCFTIVIISVGALSDFLINRQFLSLLAIRKINNSIGHIIPGIFLLLTTLIGCNQAAAVVLMCLAVGIEGFVGPGYYANNLDIAGRFAGVTWGICNTLGSICGVVAPLVAGEIMEDMDSIYGWRLIFGISAGFSWLAAIVFIFFGRGETEKWAKVDKEKPNPIYGDKTTSV